MKIINVRSAENTMATNGTARLIRRGNCYVAAEALYHILGGRESHWVVMRLPTRDDQHWFLKHKMWGTILDPSRLQFLQEPDYRKAKRAAFLTRRPSKRALKLITEMTWQKSNEISDVPPRKRTTRKRLV